MEESLDLLINMVITTNIDGKWISIHRIIMEFLVGRKLESDEVVDHINGNTIDNSFSNLRLVTQAQNMNNKITRAKISTNYIYIVDLFGDVVSSGPIKLAIEKVSDVGYVDLSLNYLTGRDNTFYVTAKINDKNAIRQKLENVVYLVSKNFSEILPFRSVNDAKNLR